jgi:hypothetical protein
LLNGEYTIMTQAGGVSLAFVAVPVIGALAAGGVIARPTAWAWSNTGGSYAGVYARSSTDQVLLFSSGYDVGPTQGRYTIENAAAGWGVLATIYNQSAAMRGPVSLRMRLDGAFMHCEDSTGGNLWMEQFPALAWGGVLIDIVEYGIMLASPVGITNMVTFDVAEPM